MLAQGEVRPTRHRLFNYSIGLRNHSWTRCSIAVIFVVVALASAMSAAAQPNVLLLTKSSGFEHDVVKESGGPSVVEQKVSAAVAALSGSLTATKDASTINAANLLNYDVVVFFTSGDLTTSGTDGQTPMASTGVDELNAWIQSGGGFIGFHSATDTFHGNAAYIGMIGAEFDYHPSQFEDTLTVVAPTHPAVSRVPTNWTLTEEYYVFQNVAPTGRTPLIVIDPQPDYNLAPYPLVWTNDYGAGRVLYSQLAHNESTWEDGDFQHMLEDAIDWAATGISAPPTPDIEFAAQIINVSEGAGSATVTVNLSVAPGTGNTVTINFATESGTAIAGADFVTTSGTLTISDAETSGAITIPIIDNTNLEGVETFGLRLSNASGGLFVDADPIATIIIADDEVDTDGDGFSDADELNGTFGYITNPNLADTDGDGISDYMETFLGTDPTDSGSAPALSTFRIPFLRK